MNVVVVGLSHKTAPVSLREKLALSAAEQPEALGELLKSEHVAEAVILSTCNRTEVYGVANDVRAGRDDVIGFLCRWNSLERKQVQDHLYSYELDRAVNHLFSVASSLDSMVIGEAQILGQVKEAYECAFEAGATGIILNRLFTHALKAGKRARSETAIGESATSVSSAAVELAKNVFADLKDRTVMVLGAGEMSELTVQALKGNGVSSVIVSNRTHQRAEELAKAFGGRAVKFDDFERYMADSDIVISSTGAPHYVVQRSDMVDVMRRRRNAPIFLIDIAVPRDVEPAVGDLYNVFLYDIDDLKSVVDSNLAERKREAEKVERIIAEESAELLAWMASLEVTPTIAQLKEKAEGIRAAEVEKILSRLSGLSDKDRNELEAATKLILAKLLHEPIVYLKEHQRDKSEYVDVEVLRKLFKLEEKTED